jgi:hypothetical protein
VSNTIRLTLNAELQEGLKFLKRRYPFLSPDEILKLSISQLYTREKRKDTLAKASLKDLATELVEEPGSLDNMTEEEFTNWWENNKPEQNNKMKTNTSHECISFYIIYIIMFFISFLK